MTTPQLSFSLNNPGAPDTVYVSAVATDNQLTLVITSNVNASFTSGTVVPINQASAGSGSLLYLDLTQLGLTQAEFNALSLDGSDWTSVPYYSPTSQVIGFSPTGPMSLTPTDDFSLTLNGFALATQPPTATVQLNVTYFRVSGVTAQNIPMMGNFGVAVTFPPDKHDKDLHAAILASLSPDEVVNCPVGGPQLANNLVLRFSPGPSPAVIKAVAGTQFTLTFIYANDANGFGAMMTPAQAQPPVFSVTAGQGASAWTITPNTGAQNPYWTLVPPVGQPIIGTGVQSTISFNISGLVTNFQPGPTVVLVAYDNVPGYQSGTYSIVVEKDPHVEISNFTVAPAQSSLTGGVANVTLSWTVSDATQLTLQPLGQDVTGQTSWPATITDTTPFTLIAEGQRPGNIDNTATADCTAYVVPVINSFEAQPSAIYQSDFPYQVGLSWNVDTAGKVNLTSSLTGPDGNSYNAVGSVTKSLTAPQMLTLTPVQTSGFSDVSRSVIVPGFTVTQSTVSNGLAGAGVAAPDNAPFIAMAVPGMNQLAILSTATFQTLYSVSVGSQPTGLAFSPDGSTLYVANKGDGTVSVVSVTNTNSIDGYTFQVAQTVQVGGAPQQVAVGADGSAWVSVDAGSQAGSLVKISNGASSPTTTSVTVGTGPRGVAVTPSNGMVFVANSGSGSVSVIANGVSGPVPRTPISNLSGAQDVAVSPDGSTLLVACSGGTTVVGVNIAYYQSAPKKTFTLSDTPQWLGVFPDGDYVVVGCSASAVLLNYAQGTTSSTSLTGVVQGVGVTPENGMALVSVAGQNGVTVLTFAQYAQVGQAVSCAGAVTDAAVTPDASTVLVWFDSLITVQGGPAPLSGVAAYSVANGSVTPYLSGKSVADLAISPGATDNAFYLAGFRQSSISVYTTSTMALLATIPLPAKTGVANRSAVRVALSADGTTLFALTNDGSNAYSVVVFSADLATKSFTVVADVSAFKSQYTPLLAFLGAAPDGSAAYTIDPIASKVYAVQQSGQTYVLGSTPIVLPANSAPAAMAVLPDGSAAYVLATIGSSNIVCTIALPGFTGQTTYLPDSQSNMNLSAVVASPDSTKLLGAERLFAGVRILDAASLRIVQTLSWQSGVMAPYGVAVSPDGSRVFTANAYSGNLAIAEQVQP